MAAEKRLIIYDSVNARVGLGLCRLTLPVWGMMAVAYLVTAGCWAMMNLMYGSLSHVTLGACFIALLVFIAGVTLNGMFLENRIQISKDGIVLPTFKRFNRFLDWRSISKVVLIGDDIENVDTLKIRFLLKRGRPITLSLRYLTTSSIEYLLVSLSNFVGSSSLDARLEQLKENLWNSSSGALEDSLSYTKMWEDELTRRFSASAYIPLSPGRKLQSDSLKVIRQLALGGWSAIYLVQDLDANLRVLKESVITSGATKDVAAKAQEMFQREAQLLLKISHPNIVSVHSQFVEDGRQYLLLDYIAGQNLRQTVQLEGPIHALDVIAYGEQICDMLIYLHGLEPSIIHRDLSPDNLVLNNKQDLILVDFGAANEMIGTATGTLVGKQCYISPEQFRGRATAASDLYALGATLYYMLTGKDPEPLTRSSPTGHSASQLKPLIERLTAQEQGDRPASAAEVKAMLRAIIESQKVG